MNAETRTRKCPQCEHDFSYPVGRGQDRRYCSDFCRTKRRHATSRSKPLCVVEGCQNPRAYSGGICNSCYYRLKRSGTLEKRQWKYRTVGTNGYVRTTDKNHPLATSGGYVFEHRKVLFDSIGPEAHPCHWCGTSVEWRKGSCRRGGLVVDHLDGVKQNNDLSNLVPACNACNTARGLFMSWVKRHKDDPVLWVMYQESRAA